MMKSFSMALFLLWGLSVCGSPALAQDGDSLRVDVKGFADTYHAMRTAKPNNWMSSRTRVRGELTLEKGGAGAFVSANLVHNAILKDQNGLQLREAYASYTSDHWNVRAGRQIITWGVADALRLTDIISPMDYTEFLAQDYDDIRIPVNGIRAKYSGSRWCAEAVAVPVPSFFEMPSDPKNPWAFPAVLAGGDKPSAKIANMEYGGRMSFFLSGVDFSFSALRTWNKMISYYRMTMLGADMSIPVGKFVIRGEMAEYLSYSSNMLLGLDWYAGNDWTLSAQYSHTVQTSGGYAGNHRNSGLATLRISKDLFNNTLSLSSFAYVDVTGGGVYDRVSADYAVNDQIHALIGYDYFRADKGMFVYYKNNSEVWIKLKYSF